MSVSLELILRRTGLSQALKLGGQEAVPEALPAGRHLGNVPSKARTELPWPCLLPAHFGSENEDGPAWPRGSLVPNAAVRANRSGAGTPSGPARFQGTRCWGTREGPQRPVEGG